MQQSVLGPATPLFLRREGQSSDQSKPLQMGKPSLHSGTTHLPKETKIIIGKLEPTSLPGQENPDQITRIMPDRTRISLCDCMEMGAVALGISHPPSLEKVLETRLELRERRLTEKNAIKGLTWLYDCLS